MFYIWFNTRPENEIYSKDVSRRCRPAAWALGRFQSFNRKQCENPSWENHHLKRRSGWTKPLLYRRYIYCCYPMGYTLLVCQRKRSASWESAKLCFPTANAENARRIDLRRMWARRRQRRHHTEIDALRIVLSERKQNVATHFARLLGSGVCEAGAARRHSQCIDERRCSISDRRAVNFNRSINRERWGERIPRRFWLLPYDAANDKVMCDGRLILLESSELKCLDLMWWLNKAEPPKKISLKIDEASRIYNEW